ncbi:MAG: restriction endonuclease subunit S [Bacteroidetes bacterium]|nr:restriction endonuclease subunit S [Bacteroidota bacterium]
MNGKQLKNSILQWAIQGKLVPQDPNDEPAYVLLEKIRAEKARLVKEGKLKKDKNESIIYRGDDNSYYEKMPDGKVKCIDEEIPFEIPSSWCWTRLNNLVYNHGQKIPDKKFSYIDIGSINNIKQKLNEKETIIEAKDAPSRARRIVVKNDIIYSTVRPYLHNVAIIDKNFTEEPIASTGFAVFSCYNGIYYRFLFFYLLSPNFDNYANNGDNAKGVAYPAINDDKLYKALIPIPPYAEQQRIVNKLDELEPIIEQYNSAQKELDVINATINSYIKKSILQEAIQGQLVKQDKTEEPAVKLLERIKLEKQHLVIEGKLKAKDVTESNIFKGDDNKYYEHINDKLLDISNEIPFDIPDSWALCRFGEYVMMKIGKTPARGFAEYWSDGRYPWVSISDMTDYGIITGTKEKVALKAQSQLGDISPSGTLLMSFKLTVGRTSILNIDAYHNEAIISIYPYVDSEHISRDYLFYILPFISNLGDSKDAIKGKTLNSKSLNKMLLPIPPLQEQKRIVDRIKGLYSKL